MEGLYGSGRSSPHDDELGRRWLGKLSEEERERGQGILGPNTICAVSVIALEDDGVEELEL